MTDSDLMPFGKYKGEMLLRVPEKHLFALNKKLSKKQRMNEDEQKVHNYIANNWNYISKYGNLDFI